MKKYGFLWILAMLLLTLTGCWDVQDITNRAYVTSLGLDQAETGEEGNLRVTFEIVLPNLLREREDKTSIIQTIEAPSIGTAIEKIQTRISRPVSMAHLRVVLLGEEFAKQSNFLDIANFFHRNPNVQMRIRLLAVKDGEARDILELTPIYDGYVAKELVSMSEVDVVRVRVVSFFDFAANLRASGGSGLITRVLESADGDVLLRQGAGIYKNWHLYGWLSSEEVRNVNWLMDEEMFIVDAKEGSSLYTLKVDRKTVQIIPVEKNGTLSFEVKLQVRGSLMQEQGDHLDATKPEVLKKLGTLFARTIKAQVESAIVKAQQDIQVDYLGFDKALRKANPEKYKQLDWKEVFPKVPITVDVETNVTRFGLSK